ncbi:hypothetical protein GCM10017044_26830 [Kordiimonas sediminis]|uniref:Thiol:disulfide interchange protein DsbD N-terminal domain-containing protein n=1 Tax=Kordiimonas sediminis TaxID=1735581 RepID=A0A919AX90_9PROT|nr:protein-disulfide reductase DsbD domain-containing protein [Kordiimonas sediminis]GHF30109.1 hypothetical protein GCM10017044_26830 [Kordiimonas sediminis]
MPSGIQSIINVSKHSLQALVFAGVVSLGSAVADDPVASTWQAHGEALKTRLVATAEISDDGRRLFAWEADLEDGWKTYWRSPGEAGLPVRLFTPSGATSEAGEIDIDFPVPERFELFGMETYGYGHHVMLPFRAAEDAVSFDADFMVCKEICIPFRASYDISSDQNPDPVAMIRLSPWLAKVPTKDESTDTGLTVTSTKVVGPVGRQRLIVELQSDQRLANADIMAEAEGMFQFSSPKKKLLGSGNAVRMVVMVMSGNRPEDLRGKQVRLTVVDGHGTAIDRTVTVN